MRVTRYDKYPVVYNSRAWLVASRVWHDAELAYLFCAFTSHRLYVRTGILLAWRRTAVTYQVHAEYIYTEYVLLYIYRYLVVCLIHNKHHRPVSNNNTWYH